MIAGSPHQSPTLRERAGYPASEQGGVVYKSVIDVDENGTEAAAATAVEVGVTSAPMNPFEMAVNRPFLFLIRHEPTDTVLFLGRVVDAAAGRSE
ncbi:serpin family protein [Haladaptatus sp. CMAA 1911]|uniref:serpin family protein n=1 Tax=unclassified Haladaptatus TaxID=2622732 RepID=UPI003754F06D